MSCAERTSALWIAFPNRHVGIAKPNQLNLIALLGKHSKLLGLSRCPLGLVVAGKPFTRPLDAHVMRLFLGFFFAVLAAARNAASVGAPGAPFFRIFFPLLRFAWMFAYKPLAIFTSYCCASLTHCSISEPE